MPNYNSHKKKTIKKTFSGSIQIDLMSTVPSKTHLQKACYKATIAHIMTRQYNFICKQESPQIVGLDDTPRTQNVNNADRRIIGAILLTAEYCANRKFTIDFTIPLLRHLSLSGRYFNGKLVCTTWEELESP